jgi:hypothetical protein
MGALVQSIWMPERGQAAFGFRGCRMVRFRSLIRSDRTSRCRNFAGDGWGEVREGLHGCRPLGGGEGGGCGS